MQRTALLLAPLLLLLLAGCQTEDPQSRTIAATPTPQGGGQVVLGVVRDIDSWNPYLCQDELGDELLSLLYPWLAIEQADYHEHPPSFAPNLAESWQWSDDHLTLTWHLRQNARWSDGTPVTARDVLFSWQVQRSAEVGWADSYYKDAIDRVEASDDHTVHMHFTRRFPYQMTHANEGLIIPAHAWSKIPFDQWQEIDWAQQALSAGPFRLVSTTRHQEIVLERNETYWRPDRPYLDRVVWRIVPSHVSLLTQMRTGAVDLVNTVPPREAERVRAAAETDLIVFPDRRYTYVGWNNSVPLFADVKVRRALTMAIDRSSILEAAIGGYGKVAVGPILSFMWAFNQELEPLPYDPEQARALLAEAGWHDSDGDGTLDRDGKPFSFELLTNNETQHHQDTVQLIHQQLGQIGIEVRTRLLDMGALFSLWVSGEFDAYVGSWQEPTIIDLEELWHSTGPDDPASNFVRYANPEVDRLIIQANNEASFEQQKPLFDRIQELVAEDQPYTFLYEGYRRSAISTRIHGAIINDASPYFNLDDWYVSPATPAASAQ
jgi:peptide/nickel transport system substrate-binding protein